jgi:hypothetical protein
MLQTGTDMPTPRRPRKSGTKEPAKIRTEEDETSETTRRIYEKNAKLLKDAFAFRLERGLYRRPCQYCGRFHPTNELTTYLGNPPLFVVRAFLCERPRGRWRIYPIDLCEFNSTLIYRTDRSAPLKRTVPGIDEARDELLKWAEGVVRNVFLRKLG